MEKTHQVISADEEHTQSSLDNPAFSLRMVLKASNLSSSDEDEVNGLAGDLSQFLRQNEGWRFDQQIKSKARLEIYRRLMPHTHPFDPARANEVVDNFMKMHGITG